MSTMAIVRSFGLRPFDVNFFESCDRFEILFIHCLPRELNSTNSKSIQLKLEPIFPLDPLPRLSGKYNLINLSSLAYLRNLENHLKSVDCINTIETHFFLSRQCAKISRKLGKKLIIMVSQNLLNHPAKYFPPYCWNTRTVVKSADLFIAISQKAKYYLESLSVDKEKIRVIPPGVNVDNFCPPAKKQNDRPRILFVGNLYESKGLPELLKADAQLHKAGFDHELWICGGGHLEPLVHEYSRKYPVRYLGFVNYEKLPEIYRECDIFCLPSRDFRILGMKIGEEQFGFTFIEAMSSALPIVTTNSGAIPEVVGSANIVVRKGSVTQLFDALKGLICNENERIRIGRSNRERVEKFFEIKKQSEKFQNEIKRLL